VNEDAMERLMIPLDVILEDGLFVARSALQCRGVAEYEITWFDENRHCIHHNVATWQHTSFNMGRRDSNDMRRESKM
jgi:hypothetical protein